MEKLRKDDPERIGPYDVVARLGSGGMGVVFLGTNGVDRVAIKVVRSSFLDDPSLRTRFVREIETLKKVSSPYVAKIMDSSVEGELAWHAVEFVNGPTLRELIDSKGPLSHEDWFVLAQQLRDALESIHSLGIVHRDVKPSNIVMSETGPKLIDFGISQDSEATSLTTTGMVAGSPAWLAPEQLEGSEITQATDLFSAGSVLTFAATGRSPWGQETSMSVPVVYQKILSGAVSLDGIEPSRRRVIEDLLKTDPKERAFHFENIDDGGQSAPVSTNAAQAPHADRTNKTHYRHQRLKTNHSQKRPLRIGFFWIGVPIITAIAFAVVATINPGNLPADLPSATPKESVSPEGGNKPGVEDQGSSSETPKPKWTECSSGRQTVDAAWDILESGASVIQLRKLDEDLSASIGGRNIAVAINSPNEAKRALYVIRTAVRAAISTGSTSSGDVQKVFAETNSISDGLNAFNEVCGNLAEAAQVGKDEFEDEESFFVEARCREVLDLFDDATILLRSSESLGPWNSSIRTRLDDYSSKIRQISYELPIGSPLGSQIRRAGDTFSSGNLWSGSPKSVLEYMLPEREKVQLACA